MLRMQALGLLIENGSTVESKLDWNENQETGARALHPLLCPGLLLEKCCSTINCRIL